MLKRIAVFVVLLISPSLAQDQVDPLVKAVQLCRIPPPSGTSNEDGIAACTTLIQSATLDTHNLAVSYNARGNFYIRVRKNDQAFADFDQTVKLEPRNGEFLVNRGWSHFLLNQLDLALTDFNAAAVADPSQVMAFMDRGVVYLRTGQFVLALADFNQADKLRPGNAGTLYDRGLAYQGLEQQDNAIADFDQAISLDPNNVVFLAERGWSYFQLKQFARAVQDYDQADKLKPGDNSVLVSRAMAYNRLGEYDLALADDESLLKSQPENSTFLNFRCWTRALQNTQLDLAMADCNDSLLLKPGPETLDSRGFVYFRLGKFAEALADYNVALKMRRGLAPSLFMRGVVEYRLGNRMAGNTDIAAAKAIMPDIEDEYKGYGVTP